MIEDWLNRRRASGAASVAVVLRVKHKRGDFFGQQAAHLLGNVKADALYHHLVQPNKPVVRVFPEDLHVDPLQFSLGARLVYSLLQDSQILSDEFYHTPSLSIHRGSLSLTNNTS